MNRRTFLHRTAVTAGGVVFIPGALRAATPASAARHFPARVVAASDSPLPKGKRPPFGWHTAAIGEIPLLLSWPDLPADATP